MSKIKVVKQKDLKDCGACALSSIIMFYDGFIPMERIRLDTNTNKDGTTAFSLIEAARKYGFDAKGVTIDSLDNSKDKETNKMEEPEKAGEKNSNEIINEIHQNNCMYNNNYINDIENEKFFSNLPPCFGTG